MHEFPKLMRKLAGNWETREPSPINDYLLTNEVVVLIFDRWKDSTAGITFGEAPAFLLLIARFASNSRSSSN